MINYNGIATKLHLIAYTSTLKPINLISIKALPIETLVKGYGTGYGDGKGYGNGDGNGEGSGDGYGEGYGDGDGYGAGSSTN